MKDYTSENPVWSDTIPVVEEGDLVDSGNDTAAALQLQQNILVLRDTKVDKEDGKGLISETERAEWDAMYQQATGYTDEKIAGLINGAPSTLDTLGEIAQAMGENEDVVEALNAAIGTKASQAEMESLLAQKLEKTGDSKGNTITFTSSDTATPTGWTNVAVLKSGETHKSFAQKVSTMFKNIRYLWKLCGSTDISKLGDGTITGALAEINGNISAKKSAVSFQDAANDFAENTMGHVLDIVRANINSYPYGISDFELGSGNMYYIHLCKLDNKNYCGTIQTYNADSFFRFACNGVFGYYSVKG